MKERYYDVDGLNQDDMDSGDYSGLIDAAEASAATSGMTRNQKWLYAEEPDLEGNVPDEQIKAWANEGQEF